MVSVEGIRPKPPELIKLYDATLKAFKIIKEAFSVPDTYTLELHDVDAAEPFLTGTADIAAITMRKIQALRWAAKSGVAIPNDVVVALAADLQRSLEHLAGCCNNDKKANELIEFKLQAMQAARCAGSDGNIVILQ
jgi:hypothetical protein